jgi:hypothetical protein
MNNKEEAKAKELVLLSTELVGEGASAVVGFLAAGPVGAAAGAIATKLASRGLQMAIEFATRDLSKREKIKVSAGLAFAYTKVIQYLEEGCAPRNDGFFDQDIGGRSAGDEILEGVLFKCKNEHEEKKLKFIGNIYANVAFTPGLSVGEANHILSGAENLTYRQMCVLALLLQKDYVQNMSNLRLRKGFSFIPKQFPETALQHETMSLFQEIFELYNRGLVACRNESGQRVALTGWISVTPAQLEISKVGARHAVVMGLNEITLDDLDDVISLLSE